MLDLQMPLFYRTWDQISPQNSVLKRTLSQIFDHTVIISWLYVQPHGMCSHVNLKSRHMPSYSSSSSSISSYFSFPGNMTPESLNSKSITFPQTGLFSRCLVPYGKLPAGKKIFLQENKLRKHHVESHPGNSSFCAH